jgi:tetratricopeptide (TPR) repeat protein
LLGLTSEHAEIVGAYLLMAGQLMDVDPELAYSHAEAARRRAARLAVTREATAETAYAAGHYDVALNEFRALRRMTGTDEYLPAMADCERALGRPQACLKIIKEGLTGTVEVSQLVELRLVEAGARTDLGQGEEALRLLKAEIERIGARGPRLARARLRYGYADLLEAAGEADQAERWFEAAAALDTDSETDAADRASALQGITLVYDEGDDDEEESDDHANEIAQGDEDVDDDEDDQDDEADEADADDQDDEDDQDVEADEADADDAGSDAAPIPASTSDQPDAEPSGKDQP